MLLGSLQAACKLEIIKEELGVPVAVVVTMCAKEMNVHGAPPSSKDYFKKQNVVTLNVSWKTSQ